MKRGWGFVPRSARGSQPEDWLRGLWSRPGRSQLRLSTHAAAQVRWRRPLGPPTHQGFTVTSVPTKPIEGQKTGTSGLRKKTKVFMSDNYLANW